MKLHKIIVSTVFITILFSTNLTFSYANDNCILRDACTGEYFSYENANPYGISLLNNSEFSTAPDNEEGHIIESLYDEYGNSYVVSNIPEPTVLPDFIDNTVAFINPKTNESYTPFPPISTQGELGSCIAFVASYYQFTYEANQLNRIDSSIQANQYSPAYVYNYLNHPTEEEYRGGETGALFDFLSERGCLKQTEFPYIPYYILSEEEINTEIQRINNTLDENSTPITSLSDDQNEALRKRINTERWIGADQDSVTKMRNALNTRVDSWYFYHTKNDPEVTGKITNPDSEILTDIKTLLAQGKVLMGHLGTGWKDNPSDANNNETYIRTAKSETDLYKYSNNEKIVCQIRNEPVSTGFFDGHAVTIVGYDDNIWVDLNKDEQKQSAECGAFKVINSWGAQHDMATFWILYDALNETSAIEHNINWPDLGEARTSIFSATYNNVHYNRIFFINVANKDVDVVGELYHELGNRSAASVNFGVQYTDDSGNILSTFNQSIQRNNGNKALYDVTVYDLSSLGDIQNNLAGTIDWNVSMSLDTNANMKYAYFRLTDNLGNILGESYSYLWKEGENYPSVQSFSIRTEFDERDVNLSGKTNLSDYNLIIDYLEGREQLSHLQIQFADMDGDNKVTWNDASGYYQWYMSN